jgi:hypothetical protein
MQSAALDDCLAEKGTPGTPLAEDTVGSRRRTALRAGRSRTSVAAGTVPAIALVPCLGRSRGDLARRRRVGIGFAGSPAWHDPSLLSCPTYRASSPRFALPGRAQHLCGIALQMFALHAEAKERAQRRHRARLARGRRAVRGLSGQESAQVGGAHLREHGDAVSARELEGAAHERPARCRPADEPPRPGAAWMAHRIASSRLRDRRRIFLFSVEWRLGPLTVVPCRPGILEAAPCLA